MKIKYMSTKKARETFKEMINICYNEDFPELHNELISLERETKKDKEPYKYERSMKEILNIVPVLADGFPQDLLNELENIYQEYLEN